MGISTNTPPFALVDNSISYAKLQANNVANTYNGISIKNIFAGSTQDKWYNGVATRYGIKYTAAAAAEMGTIGFYLLRFGTVASTPVTYTIRRTSDDGLVASVEALADANTINNASWTLYSAQFASAFTLPAGEYYFCVEYAGGTDSSNCLSGKRAASQTDATLLIYLYNGSWSAGSTNTPSFLLQRGQKWTFS
jgi:hypothetical protein